MRYRLSDGVREAVTEHYHADLTPEPAISPDSRTLAYALGTGAFGRDRPSLEIRLLDLRTMQERRFLSARPTLGPCFSPNGRKLAYSGWVRGKWQAFISSLDGKHTRQLTTGGGWNPIFSPDGRKIAYTRGGLENRQLVIMNLSSGKKVFRKLTGIAVSLKEWERLGLFEVGGYFRQKKVLKVKVFGPGTITVQGKGIRTIRQRIRHGGSYRLPVHWNAAVRKTKVRVKFAPSGGMSDEITKQIHR